jgi:uncharacterized protein (DUF1778 family)
MQPGQPNVNLRLDDEDLKLLQEASKREKLNRSDTIRRAIRAYAKQLGISPQSENAA